MSKVHSTQFHIIQSQLNYINSEFKVYNIILLFTLFDKKKIYNI